MHNFGILPEALLLVIIIVAQEYYSEMRSYRRNALFEEIADERLEEEIDGLV